MELLEALMIRADELGEPKSVNSTMDDTDSGPTKEPVTSMAPPSMPPHTSLLLVLVVTVVAMLMAVIS